MAIDEKIDIDVNKYLLEKKLLVDNHLNSLLYSPKSKSLELFWDASKYSLLSGGKRLRAALCIATYESTRENLNAEKDALTVASCLEVIHTMSLIHDDLPCMDDDDIRRGQPSSHKKYGEANALLVGDGMLTLPAYWISDKCENICSESKLKIISEISKTFSFGLVPGQIKDLECSSSTEEDINEIYKLKTAELIKCSVLCGALINNTNKEVIKSLGLFGLKIGVAFQIIDDILDITSDSKTLGKTAGKDIEQNKKTLPSILGIDKSKEKAKNLIEEAKNELNKITISSPTLSSLANFVVKRIN